MSSRANDLVKKTQFSYLTKFDFTLRFLKIFILFSTPIYLEKKHECVTQQPNFRPARKVVQFIIG